MNFIIILKKKYFFAFFYFLLILFFSIFVLLDALVIEKGEVIVTSSSDSILEINKDLITDDGYSDENITLKISHTREMNSDIHIADVQIKDISYLKTAFAKNTYGKNVTENTSDIAKNNKALFAVNGDFYAFRDFGFVLRDKIVYRNTARPSGKDDALIIYNDGSCTTVLERETSIEKEQEKAKSSNKEIVHILSFGPTLVNNDKILDPTSSNYDHVELSVNPRTAFGVIEPLHYLFVCIDGRSKTSEGVTSVQLAQYMKKMGCNLAYSLDGGSSSTMYFNDQIINVPSAGIERSVSDIVYIGY